MKFDKSKVLDYFITSLRNKKLIPKPHLGVLNTKYPEVNKGGLFTISDRPASQNIIGYDFMLHGEGLNPSTITKFSFWVRNGEIRSSKESDEKSFTPIQVTIGTNVKKISSYILIKNTRTDETYLDEEMTKIKQTDSKTFFKSSWKKDFEVNYKLFGKNKEMDSPEKNQVYLSFIKNIKKENNDIYRIQLRIVNEKETELFKNIGITDENIEKYQKVSKGILLDFNIVEESEQAKLYITENRWGTRSSIKRLFNLVAQKETISKIELNEYFRGSETIPKFEEGVPKEEFVKRLNKKELVLHPEVINAYQHIKSFYKYQEEGITKIISELKNKEGIVNIISIRTAGGKTETFTVPVLNYCYEHLDKIGTKSIIFYPTKALANDQASRIFKNLYFLNQILKKNLKRQITMGIYHGDIKKKPNEEKEVWIPFKCPKDECEGLIEFKTEGIRNIVQCSKCGEILDYLFLTRYEIHSSIPDILITNQDTLHFTMMKNPQNHSILGRTIVYCGECGDSYISKRTCLNCNKPLVKIEPQCSPEIIVMDEIHMLGGAFGINTSMFIKRLINLIGAYSKEDYKPTFIGATATIKNPKEFTKQLFNNSNVNLIPLNKEEAYKKEDELNTEKDFIRREHLFILPRAYDSSDTLSFGVSFILKYFAENLEEKPTVLGFCESIKDNRNLIKLTNSRKPKIQNQSFRIAGHTSQFEKDLRAEIEKKFTKKEIDVLYATSTLEVGVDFDDINILLLHGTPYSFNDFLQRIGRSGRRKDAAVITTLRKWSALDYFYLEKCRSMLENPDKFIVDPPFNEKNEVILKNHIRASFFDYLSKNQNTEKIYKMKELKEFISLDDKIMSNEFKYEFKEYVKRCFKLSTEDEIKIIDEIIKEFEKQIFVNTDIQNINELFDNFNENYQIGKLRTSDKVVEVIFQI